MDRVQKLAKETEMHSKDCTDLVSSHVTSHVMHVSSHVISHVMHVTRHVTSDVTRHGEGRRSLFEEIPFFF